MPPNYPAIRKEADKFAGSSNLLNTCLLFDAARDDPKNYPGVYGLIVMYFLSSAKRMCTKTLVDSGKWTYYNCGAGNHGTWAVLQRNPTEDPLLAEINRIRGNASGISTRHMCEVAGETDFPEITAVSALPPKVGKCKITQTLRQACWIRRSKKSTYWYAPGTVIE